MQDPAIYCKCCNRFHDCCICGDRAAYYGEECPKCRPLSGKTVYGVPIQLEPPITVTADDFRKQNVSLNRGPCAVCGKDVIHAYPWWTGNPEKPGAKPLHDECAPMSLGWSETQAHREQPQIKCSCSKETIMQSGCQCGGN